MKKVSIYIVWCCLIGGFASFFAGCAQTVNKQEALDIVPVLSSFPVGFGLYSYGDLQFVTFYDAEHYMTIACRKLGSSEWDFQRLDTKVGWDSHNSVIVKIDAKEHIHVVGNMHASPLIYFRSAKPLDIHSMVRIPQICRGQWQGWMDFSMRYGYGVKRLIVLPTTPCHTRAAKI